MTLQPGMEAGGEGRTEKSTEPLAGGTALFAVRLDSSNDSWTTAMLAGVRAAAGPAARVLEWRESTPDTELAEVDAVFCWNPPPGLLRRLPRLRVVASLGAGVDHCAAEHASVASDGVALVRCVDPLAARRLADYVLWAVLHLTRRMEDFAEAQARARWDSSPQSADPSNTRVGVLGLGAMGSAAAESLARNGFLVSAWSRTGGAGRSPPAGVPAERLLAGDGALELILSSADVLVCVLPLTEATRGLLCARRLRALPAGAAFVNVGRAECVVHDDLLAALDDGHISRAVLDVAPQEPLSGAGVAFVCKLRQVLRRCSSLQQSRRSGSIHGCGSRRISPATAPPRQGLSRWLKTGGACARECRFCTQCCPGELSLVQGDLACDLRRSVRSRSR